MGKNKKGKSGQKPSVNNTKKNAKQIFKVASSSTTKKGQKKTKEIPKKLKQLDLKTKDKADQQLKDLHLKMVSKKEVKQTKSIAKKKGAAAPSTEKVGEDLIKMNVK